ncbi:hypothetical protein QFZ48_003983 [Chitinophaga sp. W2I13]
MRQQIKEAQKSVQQAMQQLNQVDMKKVQADIAEATKNIKWDEVSAEARKAQEESVKALKNIDWSKISAAQKEAAEALNSIDFAALNKNLQAAYASVNTKEFYDKISKETKAGLKAASLATQNATSSLEEVRRNRAEALANAARVRENIARDRENAKRTLEGEMRAKEGAERAREGERRAKEGAERAKEGEKRAAFYKEMISQMEADKLLDAQKGYKIEKNENGLFINDVKQPDNVAAKYQKYLQTKRLTIKGSANSYHSDIQN